MQEVLNIKSTEDTPEVFFCITGISSISGRSIPENAFSFYEPILVWVKELNMHEVKQFTLVFNLDYFNSSSGRYIYEILYQLEKSPHKSSYKIIWKYEIEDDLMFEKGEAIESICSIPFEFIEISSA